jgi:hypothetical protein
VKIRLSARAAGAYEFQARLEAPNLELPDEIPAPLQVLPGPAPGGAENGNGDST